MKISLYAVSLMSFACLSLIAIPNNPLDIVQGKTPLTRQTPQSAAVQYSFDDYKKECLQRARGEGLAADVAEDLCKCTITKFRSRYKIEQFRALVQKSKKDKAAARSLSEAGEACFEEVLYEQ